MFLWLSALANCVAEELAQQAHITSPVERYVRSHHHYDASTDDVYEKERHPLSAKSARKAESHLQACL